MGGAPRRGVGRAGGPLSALALGVAVLGSATGCGVLSAVSNPSAAWALSESSTMTVVLRRAEVAQGTAHQIDRLMSATPLNEKSAWVPKTAVTTAEGEASMKSAGTEPAYAGQPVRVVAAEAWLEKLSAICSSESKYASLFAAVSPEVAAAHADLESQAEKLTSLRAAKKAEEQALDDKGTLTSDREKHEKERDRLRDEIVKVEAAYDPKLVAFLEKLRADAGKVPAGVKDTLGFAVVNLRRAVIDARTANAVAMVRYPLAVTSLTTDLQMSAKRFVADVIEEKTGHRPDMSRLQPDVKLDGTDVKLTLNGLPPEALGSLNPAEVLAETTRRAKAYAERVLTLVVYGADTEDLLTLEAKELDALKEGLSPDASKVKGDSLSDVKVVVTPPAPGKPAVAVARAGTGARSPGGLRAAPSCGKATGAVAAGSGGRPRASAGAAAESAKSPRPSAVKAQATVDSSVAGPKAHDPAETGEVTNDCNVAAGHGKSKTCL